MTKQSKREKSQLTKLKRNIKALLKGPGYETPATKRHRAGKVGSERVRKKAAEEAAIKAAGAKQFDRLIKETVKKRKKKVEPKKIKPKKKPVVEEPARLAPLKSALTAEEIKRFHQKRQK